jgi:two-component system, NarL family, response regulator DegU
MPVIKIMIVENLVSARQGLQQKLSLKDDFMIVGETEHGDEVIEKVSALKPDVVLVDIHLSGENGIEITTELKQKMPSVNVLGLIIDVEQHYLSNIIKAGASGFIFKDTDAETLYEAIKTVARGDAYIEPCLLAKFLAEYRESSFENKQAVLWKQLGLTRRELEIVNCIACGESNKVIAETLFISEKTVKNHVRNILKKMGLVDRTQIAVYVWVSMV